MKKSIKGVFILVFALMLFIPISVLAEEKAYEYFNFKVDLINGEKINDSEVKIFASVEGDEKNLTDRTDEFDVEEIMWSECEDDICSTSKEVEEDAVFEEDKGYVFMIRITAKNGADINVWGTDRAMFNGTPIEYLEGEYGNTGTELLIKSKVVEEKTTQEEKTDIEESTDTVETTGVDSSKTNEKDENTCMLGLSLCCTTFLGLSLCIWILIAILIILLIIIICALKSKKNQQ